MVREIRYDEVFDAQKHFRSLLDSMTRPGRISVLDAVPLDAPPGKDWSFTGERFLDPPSGETLEVWYCPRTGERAYVRARAG